MFYTFNQNNSGGSFDYDESEGISHFVIFEAASANQANYHATGSGIYFSGCAAGRDCDCCGDRWYEANDSDGTDVPTVYGEDVLADNWEPYSRWMQPNPEGFIHYEDGRVVPFGVPADAKASS